MKPLTTFAGALALVSFATIAAAHDEPKPMFGGRVVHAGSWHVELVTKDKAVEVYLSDHDSRPVQSAGFKGVAILVVDGKPQRIPLAPAGETRLTGNAAVSLPAQVKGAVQLTGPGNKSANAKFD